MRSSTDASDIPFELVQAPRRQDELTASGIYSCMGQRTSHSASRIEARRRMFLTSLKRAKSLVFTGAKTLPWLRNKGPCVRLQSRNGAWPPDRLGFEARQFIRAA